MSKIKKVENKPNFPQLEDNINKFWKENNIFQKSVDGRSIENSYSFVDGPPFVSGMPHYGHLLTSIAKDVVPRFWTMKGKRVRRVWGWDCHGLPVEAKVNKKFNIKSSDQVEKEIGVDKYVEACREYVESTSSDWRWYIEKIGRWVDIDNAYYTMNPEFNESVIWAFKRMYEKGLIYKGKRVSLFSTDTSTPVSNFEVAMDPDNYQDTEDLSIFVKFKLETDKFDSLTQGDSVYLTAWTTTPWTIPSNTGLAVNPNETYCLVNFEGQYLVLAKKRLNYTFNVSEDQIGTEADKVVKVLKEFSGIELEGMSYESVYDFFLDEKTENDYKVYLYEGVTVEDGTGVLHLAPAFGEEDFNLGKEHGLSGHQDINEEGKMTVGDWKGVYLRDASPMIAEDLAKKGNLLRSQIYKHRLPYYRGDNPLIYMAQESYFVNIQKIKGRMVELNEDINWIPGAIKHGRFKQTIETSPDWAVSRSRYWATIMPVWRAEDGEEIVVGSFDEMMEYTDQIEKKSEAGKNSYYLNGKKMSLHRDFCDKIVFEKDGKEYYRIPEVLDSWMDAGSVPFAEHHYPFENKESFEKAFPADFIVEYVAQARAWFNVLFRISTILFDAPAYKNVICHGVLAGNDGRKMSKTYGNYPDAKNVLENIGAEAVRLYLMGSPLMAGGDTSWSDESLSEQVKTVLIPLWNTYKYLSIYAELHNWTPTDTKFSSTNILDKWLRNYMDNATLEYEKALESYDIPASVKLIQPAIDNISSWWIRRSRDRFVSGDAEALQTLYSTLVQFIKTFAPQMPFVCEEIYQNLVVNAELAEAKESVHLEDFPEIKAESVNLELLKQMDVVREVCSLGLSVRVENAMKIRQPLNELRVVSSELESLDVELLEIIKDEINVKNIKLSSESVKEEGYLIKTQENITVELDTRMTPELKEEGLLNEVMRQFQNFRKESGLQMGEMVEMHYFTSSIEIRDMIDANKEKLMKTASLKDLVFMDDLEGKSLKVEDESIVVSVVR